MEVYQRWLRLDWNASWSSNKAGWILEVAGMMKQGIVSKEHSDYPLIRVTQRELCIAIKTALRSMVKKSKQAADHEETTLTCRPSCICSPPPSTVVALRVFRGRGEGWGGGRRRIRWRSRGGRQEQVARDERQGGRITGQKRAAGHEGRRGCIVARAPALRFRPPYAMSLRARHCSDPRAQGGTRWDRWSGVAAGE